MRSYEEVLADLDTTKQPFSNGTEFEIWAGSNCYDCVNDDTATERYCPILSAALGGMGWPTEWTRRTHHWQVGGGSGSYEVVDTCTEFEERRDDEGDEGDEPEPEPPPVVEGQLDLIDAYLDTAITELTSDPVVSR